MSLIYYNPDDLKKFASINEFILSAGSCRHEPRKRITLVRVCTNHIYTKYALCILKWY